MAGEFPYRESVKDPEKIKKKLNSGKPVLGIYLLTLSENPVNLMDIIPAAMLIQKSFMESVRRS